LNNDDATILAVALQHNTTLEDLDLRANNIRDNGVVSLAEYLVGGRRQTSNDTNLTKLSLFGNPFGEMGGQSLLAGIRHNTNLKVLNMEYNLSQYDTIQFYTFLNRMGRRVLKEGHAVLPGVWPMILEQANGRFASHTRGICTPNDLLYTFLRDPAVFGSLR
jgi:Ran GTPase-activating protein (RanGAP) involved in mRNA processing and transport